MKHCYVGMLAASSLSSPSRSAASMAPFAPNQLSSPKRASHHEISRSISRHAGEKEWPSTLVEPSILAEYFSSWGMAFHDDSTRPVLPEWQRAAMQGAMISTSYRNTSCPQVPQGTNMCTDTPHRVDCCCACPHLREHTTLSSPLSCTKGS